MGIRRLNVKFDVNKGVPPGFLGIHGGFDDSEEDDSHYFNVRSLISSSHDALWHGNSPWNGLLNGEYCGDYERVTEDLFTRYSMKNLVNIFEGVAKARIKDYYIPGREKIEGAIRRAIFEFGKHDSTVGMLQSRDDVTEIFVLDDCNKVFGFIYRECVCLLLHSAVNLLVTRKAIGIREHSTPRKNSPAILYDLYKKFGGLTPKKVEQSELKKITLGADPEFEFYRVSKSSKRKRVPEYKDGIVSVSEYIEDECHIMPLGLDGCSDTGEVRPKPAKTPQELADNIEIVMGALERRLSTLKSDIFVHSGGGFQQSIGGHIHLGNPILKKMYYDHRLNPLGKMLDSFLYFPMRDNMPGTVRNWIYQPECGSRDIRDGSIYSSKFRPVMSGLRVQNAVKETKKIPRYVMFSREYERPSSFRANDHGIEYRTLPSFICDKEFTRIVMKIAHTLCNRFIDHVLNKKEYEYNCPPTENDYIDLIGKKDTERWYSYLFGRNRSAFLRDLRVGWKTLGKLQKAFELKNKLRGDIFKMDIVERFTSEEKLQTELLPITKELTPVIFNTSTRTIPKLFLSYFHDYYCHEDRGFSTPSYLLFNAKVYISPQRRWARDMDCTRQFGRGGHSTMMIPNDFTETIDKVTSEQFEYIIKEHFRGLIIGYVEPENHNRLIDMLNMDEGDKPPWLLDRPIKTLEEQREFDRTETCVDEVLPGLSETVPPDATDASPYINPYEPQSLSSLVGDAWAEQADRVANRILREDE